MADADGVLYQTSANGGSANPAQFTNIAFTGGNAMRFGRLRMFPAVGPTYRDLKANVQTEYWNGSTWTVNTDDGCTSLPQNTITLGSYGGNVSACKTRVFDGGAGTTVNFTSGIGKMYLSNVGSGTNTDGSVLLSANLGSTSSGQYCPTVGGAGNQASTTAANLDFLQGAWDGGSSWTVNPSARAAFGVFGAPPRSLIFQRENY